MAERDVMEQHLLLEELSLHKGQLRDREKECVHVPYRLTVHGRYQSDLLSPLRFILPLTTNNIVFRL